MTIITLYRTDFDDKIFHSYEAAQEHETTHQIAQKLSDDFGRILTEDGINEIADWVFSNYVKDQR